MMKYLLILLLSVVTMPFAFAQNTLDNIGLSASSPSSGAYSLRLLSTSYTGAAIEVRRSSDNTTQNIGFTGGDLDTNSLISFVGSGDGFVSIWFDQSGNGNNAVQSTLLNQPKIITAGIIERANALPTITFSGSQFLVISSTAFNNDLTGCLVYKASGSNTSSGSASSWYNMNGIFGSEQSGATTDFAYGIYNNKFTAGNGLSDNSVGGNETVNDNVTRLHSWTRNSTTGQITLYANGASEGTANLNAGTRSAVTSVAIGANQTFSGGQVFYNGNVSELLLFAAVLANPRQTTEWNQGTYYSIAIIRSTLTKNGKFSPTASELVNRNGAIGVSGIYRTGSTTTTIALSAPTTTDASAIASASAISGFSIASDGGATISAGVCWSTVTNPTITDTKTIDAGAAGTFTSSITNLIGNTTYYARAYATNSVGTVYGNEISFTTLQPVIPSVITTVASSVKGTVASSGGTIGTDGGATVTARGICWSTSTSPTTADFTTSDGSGMGTYISSMAGLSLGTTYYARAYATNSVGTAYGNEISFTTNASLSVGDTYQGGYIAYIFITGDKGYVVGEIHGLIAATADQGGLGWTTMLFSNTGATATSIGAGAANTTIIIDILGNFGSYAAKVCRDYSGGGYTDWFLPSKAELNKIYVSRAAIGGFIAANYWSSSEVSSSNAYSQNFSTGATRNINKSQTCYVRPIRTF